MKHLGIIILALVVALCTMSCNDDNSPEPITPPEDNPTVPDTIAGLELEICDSLLTFNGDECDTIVFICDRFEKVNYSFPITVKDKYKGTIKNPMSFEILEVKALINDNRLQRSFWQDTTLTFSDEKVMLEDWVTIYPTINDGLPALDIDIEWSDDLVERSRGFAKGCDVLIGATADDGNTYTAHVRFIFPFTYLIPDIPNFRIGVGFGDGEAFKIPAEGGQIKAYLHYFAYEDGVTLPSEDNEEFHNSWIVTLLMRKTTKFDITTWERVANSSDRLTISTDFVYAEKFIDENGSGLNVTVAPNKSGKARTFGIGVDLFIFKGWTWQCAPFFDEYEGSMTIEQAAN